jgi:hypothetical protein
MLQLGFSTARIRSAFWYAATLTLGIPSAPSAMEAGSGGVACTGANGAGSGAGAGAGSAIASTAGRIWACGSCVACAAVSTVSAELVLKNGTLGAAPAVLAAVTSPIGMSPVSAMTEFRRMCESVFLLCRPTVYAS